MTRAGLRNLGVLTPYKPEALLQSWTQRSPGENFDSQIPNFCCSCSFATTTLWMLMDVTPIWSELYNLREIFLSPVMCRSAAVGKNLFTPLIQSSSSSCIERFHSANWVICAICISTLIIEYSVLIWTLNWTISAMCMCQKKMCETWWSMKQILKRMQRGIISMHRRSVPFIAQSVNQMSDLLCIHRDQFSQNKVSTVLYTASRWIHCSPESGRERVWGHRASCQDLAHSRFLAKLSKIGELPVLAAIIRRYFRSKKKTIDTHTHIFSNGTKYTGCLFSDKKFLVTHTDSQIDGEGNVMYFLGKENSCFCRSHIVVWFLVSYSIQYFSCQRFRCNQWSCAVTGCRKATQLSWEQQGRGT